MQHAAQTNQWESQVERLTREHGTQLASVGEQHRETVAKLTRDNCNLLAELDQQRTQLEEKDGVIQVKFLFLSCKCQRGKQGNKVSRSNQRLF